MKYTEQKLCRLDGGSLETILDLGKIYPSNFVDENKRQVKVPLVLTRGMNSSLVQLKHTIDMDKLYRNYWYRSDLNPNMVKSLQDIVTRITRRVSISKDDIIVDIGANDGTMLAMFPEHSITVGFDPAENLKESAEERCNIFINDYFDKEKYPLTKKAKVITSIAMFYDLMDPNTFIKDVKSILDRSGIWVIQMTDLLSMLKINAFDNIVHEHLEYYSLEVLVNLMKCHDLHVYDVSYNKVNGGSIRAYISHAGLNLTKGSVPFYLSKEKEYMESFDNPFVAFKDRVERIKLNTMKFIKKEVKAGKVIYGMGASTKGNTLLQYFGLTPKEITAIAEVNKDKFGLKTVGTKIPIISEKEALKDKPDYFFVLPWHFIDNFVERNKKYLNAGGKFIVPCPVPAVISKEGKEWI